MKTRRRIFELDEEIEKAIKKEEEEVLLEDPRYKRKEHAVLQTMFQRKMQAQLKSLLALIEANRMDYEMGEASEEEENVSLNRKRKRGSE